LLERERIHVSKFEHVLSECIETGQIVDLNVRVAANLIKSMTEAWVLKRWDLRGHIERIEMGKVIIDFLFSGLLTGKGPTKGDFREVGNFQGKSVLVLNGESLLAKAISFSLLTKGARLAIQTTDGTGVSREYPISEPEKWQEATLYSTKEYGELTPKLFKQIVDDFGHIDVIIHDLGMKASEAKSAERKMELIADGLQKKLFCAQNLASSIGNEMKKTRSGKLLYLAPWAWDKFLDPLCYQSVMGGAEALTEAMAQKMSDVSVNVNCVIPGFIGGVRPLSIEKKMYPRATEEIPIGYLGEILDVLEAVWFLISDKSKYITGQVLRVSGGMA
jgi:NAD(P)-dependent dehydrogenase (short-subunit alcohol dehydrogenase family)